MRALLAAFCLASLATGARAQAYRCEDAAGAVTYQAQACNGRLVVAPPATPLPPPPRPRSELDRLTEAACLKRGAAREPTLGMPEADLSCMPQFRAAVALTVNETRTAAGRQVQYVYPRALLYFTEGRLTAIQGRSGR